MAAVLAESRVSPLDGGNMNRAFPGGADAGPTRGLAGFVTAHLLPGADLVLDMHSGGAGMVRLCGDSRTSRPLRMWSSAKAA